MFMVAPVTFDRILRVRKPLNVSLSCALFRALRVPESAALRQTIRLTTTRSYCSGRSRSTPHLGPDVDPGSRPASCTPTSPAFFAPFSAPPADSRRCVPPTIQRVLRPLT